MRDFLNFLLCIAITGTLLSCASQPTSEDEVSSDEASMDESGSSNADKLGGDDFSDSAPGEGESGDSSLAKEDKPESDTNFEGKDDEFKNEGNEKSDKKENLAETKDSKPIADDPMTDELKKDSGTEETPAPVITEENSNPIQDVPQEEPTPVIAEPKEDPKNDPNTSNQAMGEKRGEIKNIKFESNEGGGSIVIEGDKAFEFSNRMNPQSNQFVVEVKNAHLPDRLKRPFVTKDFQSSVGSIDAYQIPGSDTVRVVVQLREGASEPSTHAEGNAIIVVASGGGNNVVSTEKSSEGDAFMDPVSGNGLLSSKNLEQFLSGNMKYYGKKIYLEVKDIEVRNAINLIAEESGANLVMSEGVTGNLALKLRNVPWDQALVLILKAKKLGYTRQGNVLRISPISEIKQEEDDAIKLVESRRKVEPLKVQMVSINYSKIADLQTQIKSIITERGNIVADPRTNSLIITETEEVLERAKKIISSLDIAPAQVLIEGKLVEARESFTKRMGIQWDNSASPVSFGDVNMTPNFSIKPGGGNLGGSLGFNLSLGTLDLLGDLNAILSLEEQEETVKVISSPRIVTLHNEEATITQGATVPVVVSERTKDGDKTYKDLELKMDLKVIPEIANNGVVQLKVNISRQFLGAPRSDGTAGTHSRSATTKVMVKSGQTAVIGGIYQNDASQVETGVPFLRSIPILGYLFKSSGFHKDKTELLLFLTPRILSQAGTPVMSQNVEEPSTVE